MTADKEYRKYAKACRKRQRWLRILGWVRKRADAADERAVTAYSEMVDKELDK